MSRSLRWLAMLLASGPLHSLAVPSRARAATDPPTVAQEILREALKPNSETDHPLPLAATWATGRIWDELRAATDYLPLWQLAQVDAGHHLIPTFATPDLSMLDPAGAPNGSLRWKEYYQQAIRRAAVLGLPIAFAGTQWEEALYLEPTWANLAPDQNPNMRVPGVAPRTTIGRVAVVATGKGYRPGDALTLAGGTPRTPARVTLTSIDDRTGAAYAASVTDQGAYAAFPAGATTARGGSGSGVRFAVFDGAFQPRLSAFGATAPWREVGRRWTSATNAANPDARRSMIAYLQEWYPEPPLVLYLSNNESKRELPFGDASGDRSSVEGDQHYLDRFGGGRPAEFKREALGAGWIVRYRALQDAMREGFVAPAWRTNVRFVGYDAFGPPHFGRWPGWIDNSLHKTGRVDPNPLAWDGASTTYYVGNGHANYPWDFKVWSPQVEAMNQVFMLEEALRLNPGFWFELSTSNDCDFYPMSRAPASEPGCANLRRTAPSYTPDRYAGTLQFGMWLVRPRVVRDFRGYGSRFADSGAYFETLLASVDKVYSNPTLREFWRDGTLVANAARPHPYQAEIPAEYRSTPRMFLLDTNLDPVRPWALDTRLPVFALARVMGTPPDRRWLVYAVSPEGGRNGVRVVLPGFRSVSISSRIGGAFSLVDERSGRVSDAETGATLPQ